MREEEKRLEEEEQETVENIPPEPDIVPKKDITFLMKVAEPDERVPDDVKELYYAYVGRDAATTVLDEDEIRMIRIGAEIMQDIDFMQLTPEEIDRMPWLLKVNQQINDLAYLRLKKSINGTLLTNSIRSVVEQVRVEGSTGEQKKGFLQRILGRL